MSSPPPSNFLEAQSDNLSNSGTVAAAVLALLLVALSTYGRRLCRHPAVRFVVWGAATVFLPLTSSIISNLLERSTSPKPDCSPPATNKDNPDIRTMWTILLWVVLIHTIECSANMAALAVSATAVSPDAGDAGIDGQKIKPPLVLLAKYAWTAGLIGFCYGLAEWLKMDRVLFVLFSALGPAKLVIKLAASWNAGDSFALGKNARLVAGYMAQLVADGDGGQEQVPRYIVMGESKEHVEEAPQGYRVKRDALEDRFSRLVTLDRVWRLAEHGNGILAERRELRDLCLSYSLFKILRRRLSGYPLADAGSAEACDFVLRGMDSVGTGGAVDADRVFRVLVDELWFASDFYFSPVPLCIFGGWSAALTWLSSVLIIAGCVALGYIYQVKEVIPTTAHEIYKVVTFFLLLVVVLVEGWEIVAGVCSNWTKMALLSHYIRHQSMWRRWPCVHAALAAVLRLKPAKRWRDKIGQNSVLEPRRFRQRTGLLSEQLYGTAGLMKSIRVSPAVKDAVTRSLLSSYGRLSKGGGAAARRVGGKVNWALYGSQKSWAWDGDASSNTEQILTWHVATRLFEMKLSTSASADMIAACHLSYYCAYLVAAAPELLPDNAAWTKKRYKEVSADVSAALGENGAGGRRGEESEAERYASLVAALAADSRDPVLRRGAELGRHLVDQYAEDEASACRILEDFWSEMLLYVAPSENVKGHVEAMARGGEFVTLVWALLHHAGVTARPDTPAAPPASP